MGGIRRLLRQASAYRLLTAQQQARKAALPKICRTPADRLPEAARAYLNDCLQSLAKPEVGDFARRHRVKNAEARRALAAAADAMGIHRSDCDFRSR